MVVAGFALHGICCSEHTLYGSIASLKHTYAFLVLNCFHLHFLT